MDTNISLPTQLLKYLKNKKLTIFLFHGVIKNNPFEVRNYTNKHIDHFLFAKCMSSLAKNGNPISMDEVLRIYKNKENFPDKSFAITFDDGFENNLSLAYPILHDFKIPSTMYITSNFVDKNEMSWVDKIEQAVECTKKKEVFLPWGKRPFKLNSTNEKIFFLNNIRRYVKHHKNIKPYLLSKNLCYNLGFDNITNLKNELDLKINWNQVKATKKNNLLSIGGHGHTHSILSYLNQADLFKEIKLCTSLIKKKGKIETPHFSYPEGLKHCYSKKVIQVLKKFNYQCSPTAIKGINVKTRDLFNLNRIMVA